MSELPVTDDFYRIVIDDIPLIDVRAPVEYQAGAFPGSVNLPILDDKDRHLVGLCYKKQGREAAFELAYKRVSGSVKQDRIQAWIRYYRKHPDALMYCFRGGMRSKTAQQWFVEETGITLHRLAGGYKAFRRYLIDALNPENVSAEPVILGGRTGAGKTILLRLLDHSIDLEAIANHRGSAFGAHLSPQPSQIDFENQLAYALIHHRQKSFRHMILEDEGSYIGARYIPHELARYFKRDCMVVLESDLESRTERTYQEYVVDSQNQYVSAHGLEQGLDLWYQYMLSRMQRIGKRLGGERLKRVMAMLEDAHNRQKNGGDASGHKGWIALLLAEYYDPMYDYQIEKSGRTILCKGGFEEVRQYLEGLEK